MAGRVRLPKFAKRLLASVAGTSHRWVYSALPRRRHVVFDGPSDYHYYHVAPLVRQLAAEGRVDITVAVHDGLRKELEVPGVRYVRELRPPVVRHYDLFISTDFDSDPWWLPEFGGQSAFIGHGVGPKVSYYATERLSCYDAMFCPGPTIYAAQSRYARRGARVYKAGLPITDELARNGYRPSLARRFFAEDKPVLLYAPTWSRDPATLPMDEAILTSLAELPDFNVVIRPHPLLLQPAVCGGKDWGRLFREIAGRGVLIHAGPGTSVYDLLPLASVLLADMSSVVFEFLLLDRPILLYIGDRIFHENAAAEFIPMIRKATTPVPHPSHLPCLVRSAVDLPERLRAARAELRSMFFYNVGSATPHCVRAIYDMLGIESWNGTGGGADVSSVRIPESMPKERIGTP